MVRAILFALVAILPSLLAVNGAVVQRDGTFTYVTPQPTSLGQAGSTTYTSTSSSQSTSTTSSAPVQSTTSSMPPVPSSTTSTHPTTSSSTTASQTSTKSLPVPPSSTTSTTSSSTTALQSSTSSVPVPPPSTTSSTSSATSTQSVIVPPSTTKSYPCTSPSVTGTPTYTCQCPPATTASMPSGTGPANCNGVQQWQAAFAYTAGNKVIYNNQLFTAIQWTYNNAPPAHPDEWAFGGVCTQPISNQADCKNVSAWQSTTAYNSGSQVTYNNHLWYAVQWAQSNAPGDTSGSWKDLGACA